LKNVGYMKYTPESTGSCNLFATTLSPVQWFLIVVSQLLTHSGIVQAVNRETLHFQETTKEKVSAV